MTNKIAKFTSVFLKQNYKSCSCPYSYILVDKYKMHCWNPDQWQNTINIAWSLFNIVPRSTYTRTQSILDNLNLQRLSTCSWEQTWGIYVFLHNFSGFQSSSIPTYIGLGMAPFWRLNNDFQSQASNLTFLSLAENSKCLKFALDKMTFYLLLSQISMSR